MDASKFKQIFLPQCPRLYAVALRLTGNGQAAEDLVQDTLLRLWMKRDSLPPDFDASAYSGPRGIVRGGRMPLPNQRR